MIAIDDGLCIHCQSCFKICPLKVIGLEEEIVKPERPDYCISCGHCISVCPVKAIRGDFESANPDKNAESLKLPPFSEIEDLMISRRSIRSYDKREVDSDTIQRILRIAAHAPTGSNRQQVKFAVVGLKGTAVLEKLAQDYFYRKPDDKIGKIVREAGFSVLLGAPVLIGFYSTVDYVDVDCVIAAQNAVIAAQSMGLGTCYNGIFLGAYDDSEDIQKYFGLSKEDKMHVFIGMGYPDSSVKYYHTIQRREPQIAWID